ncbi:acyl-CoA dehydrogenase family protein [Actinomadura macrotermitis]|uniref:Acyl-CoA dehydrogenase FadE28 n=1 Tax=Actinomadura macrotermitis TaxID=2585200 RepID=A0A7K0BM88_9ACTN|nr:acyl-CoA dehydrogenase family protein [Actinomadura macrotermitis]MQY02283.1 Acyl-CoA dehydrogenase FadE28 [Actinomadura macrotermitis]
MDDPLLAATADEILAAADPWPALEEAGLTAVGVPEEAGGSGGTLADAAVLLRASGYHAAAVPLAETGWLAGRALAEAGLPVPPGPLTACADPRRVPWARGAHRIVVVRDGEARVYDPAGLEIVPGANLAGEPRDEIVLGGARPVAAGPCGADLRLRGALARAVQLTGAMRRALELSVRYAGEREQFGRPIGRFQAVQQALAELAGEVAIADVAVRAAVRTPDDPVAVGAAKANASRAAGTVASIAHQVHGALGVTAEHPLHTITLRLWSWREEFGGEAFWAGDLGGRAAGSRDPWPFLIGM